MALPGGSATGQRKALVCFDYEGCWGMPFRAPYDIEVGTHSILDCLGRHDVRAIFFAVGALALERPDLIRTISECGHEVGSHGWRHEHLDRLTGPELARFSAGLKESEVAIESVTGRPPTGFRAPFLLGPKFFDPRVYGMLARHGYRWVSNREIRHPVELARPDRIRTELPSRLLQDRPALLAGALAQALLLTLNAQLVAADPVGGSARSAIRWLRRGFPPFFRGQLLEVPLYSPLDCDLIGFSAPSTLTPPSMLEFARFALRTALSRSGPLTMLTFHDWLIAGGNRLALLDDLLGSFAACSVQAVTVEECWRDLTQVAELGAEDMLLAGAVGKRDA